MIVNKTIYFNELTIPVDRTSQLDGSSTATHEYLCAHFWFNTVISVFVCVMLREAIHTGDHQFCDMIRTPVAKYISVQLVVFYRNIECVWDHRQLFSGGFSRVLCVWHRLLMMMNWACGHRTPDTNRNTIWFPKSQSLPLCVSFGFAEMIFSPSSRTSKYGVFCIL